MNKKKSSLYHIVATSGEEMVIGKDNQLPWPKYPEDLKFFKETTMGSTIIMGRKTFLSIGRPLPGRQNFVLSRAEDFKAPDGVRVFHSIEEALQKVDTEKAFIIGGADLYRQTINQVEGIYQTKIKEEYPGDARYPSIPSHLKINREITRQLQEKYPIDVVYLCHSRESGNPNSRSSGQAGG